MTTKAQAMSQYLKILTQIREFERKMLNVLAHPDVSIEQIMVVTTAYRDILTHRQNVANEINSKFGHCVDPQSNNVSIPTGLSTWH